ncbi:hypothetical protein FQN54_007417 [Arachnomyces sp. PD_36]|nr:hypothetical protein FQN54_007417 [Arachnomyces sp. PD_36]
MADAPHPSQGSSFDTQPPEVLDCPFCEFSDSDTYFLSQHVELCHPEGGYSPFIAKDDDDDETAAMGVSEAAGTARDVSGNDTGDGYAECPRGCGEIVVASELTNHLDFHVAEEMALGDIGAAVEDDLPRSSSSKDLIEDRFATDISKALRDHDHIPKLGSPASKGKQNGPGRTRRLGRSELGPHAHEKQMPTWLRNLLEDGTKVTTSNQIGPDGKLVKVETVANETSHLIPILAGLCEKDSSVEKAFLCSPEVRHIFKLPKEGGFCGYRNIQMMVSYIQDSRADGHQRFPGRVPSIMKLQDMIEEAWDLGFNSTGRVETGGIRGTRKYIGTPEAQALFMSVGVLCEANAFNPTSDARAHDSLLVAVANYFGQADGSETDGKVLQTKLPPVYLQHQGNNSYTLRMCIELRTNGNANLLVFDPMFKTSPAMRRLIGGAVKSPESTQIMRAYRRGGAYLQKYRAFETLQLVT